MPPAPGCWTCAQPLRACRSPEKTRYPGLLGNCCRRYNGRRHRVVDGCTLGAVGMEKTEKKTKEEGGGADSTKTDGSRSKRGEEGGERTAASTASRYVAQPGTDSAHRHGMRVHAKIWAPSVQTMRNRDQTLSLVCRPPIFPAPGHSEAAAGLSGGLHMHIAACASSLTRVLEQCELSTRGTCAVTPLHTHTALSGPHGAVGSALGRCCHVGAAGCRAFGRRRGAQVESSVLPTASRVRRKKASGGGNKGLRARLDP